MIKEKHVLKNPYNHHALSRYIDVYEVSANRCHSVPESGYKGTEATLVDDPAWNEKFSSYSITGATLTGNNFILNNDVTAQAIYETAKNLTLQTDGHGSIAANKNSGFIGDQVTLSNTPDERYSLSGYSITGATLTGNKFNFIGNDVTAKAWFSAIPLTLTLETDGNGTLTATKITGNPGDTVTLTPTYNTYYRFSGYSVTGGSINGNTFTFGNGNATAKAWFRGNTFTASGEFYPESEWVGISAYTDETKTGKYNKAAITNYTNNVPNSWFTTSSPWGSRSLWFPTGASNYSMTAKLSMRNTLTYAYAGTSIITATFKTYTGQSTVKTNISTEVKNLDYAQTGNTPAQHTGSVSSFIWKPTIVTTAHNGYYVEGVECYVACTDSRGRYRGLKTYANTAAADKGSWTATGYAP